jgi:hypothetical protein
MNATSSATPGVLCVACLQTSSFTFQRPWHVNKAFPDMGVLTKYDQIEPICLSQSVVTYCHVFMACGNQYAGSRT